MAVFFRLEPAIVKFCLFLRRRQVEPVGYVDRIAVLAGEKQAGNTLLLVDDVLSAVSLGGRICPTGTETMRKVEKSLLVLNQGEGDSPHHDDGVLVAPAKPALMQPSRYRVIMMNDDYTPMDFVVDVLMTFFGMNEEQATQVMLLVHTQGKAACGVFSKDVAETKAAQVNQYSSECEHPLLCEIERAD